MTGEMYEATRDEWPTHFAIADAVGGTVQPFDQYQGPYIVVESDIRIGNTPYAYAPPGPVRLWMVEEGVYREDTDTLAWCLPYDELSAIEAAISLLD